MKLYIKQKAFSLADRFDIFDADGNVIYYAEGEVFTFGKRLHVFDAQGNEVLFLKQRLTVLKYIFDVFSNGEEIAEIIKRFSFRPKYDIKGPDWYVEGTFSEHDFNIVENGMSVASVHKAWMTWGDSYEIDIMENVDLLLALGVILAIDAVMAAEAAAAAAAT